AEYGLQEYDWAGGAIIAKVAGVAVRRPAWQQSDQTPEWMLAGDLGIDHHQLDVDQQQPVARTVLNGTVETTDPAGWNASIQDSSPAEHTNITVGNFIVDWTVGDGVVSVTATGPADQVHTLEQRLAAVRW